MNGSPGKRQDLHTELQGLAHTNKGHSAGIHTHCAFCWITALFCNLFAKVIPNCWVYAFVNTFRPHTVNGAAIWAVSCTYLQLSAPTPTVIYSTFLLSLLLRSWWKCSPWYLQTVSREHDGTFLSFFVLIIIGSTNKVLHYLSLAAWVVLCQTSTYLCSSLILHHQGLESHFELRVIRCHFANVKVWCYCTHN